MSEPMWDFYVTPSGYQDVMNGAFFASDDPLTACIHAAYDGSSLKLVPGNFPRARGPFGGKRNIHICGWDRARGISTLKRDTKVGSSDSFLLGEGDTNFVLEMLNIECDDRAAVKTNPGVGPKNALIDCNLYGFGSPHDPLWKDDSKWAVQSYEVAGWNEVRCFKWSVFGEHGAYVHNQQGVVNYAEGGAGYLGGCDIFHVARQNEGKVGKGDTNIQNRFTEDVCVGQGGSAYTFRGGVPGGRINIDGSRVRLGCNAALAAPFNENICGVLSVDSADETAPGKGDAAWPGNYASVNLRNLDWEVGTIYQGRSGMIRPVATPGACDLLTMHDCSIRVKRAPGAYPIALAIPSTCKDVQITGMFDIVGWIDYQGTRYTTPTLFKQAHPEFFG